MKINRKKTPDSECFGELLPSTTFVTADKTTVFMKLNMSTADIYCHECDDEIDVNDEYAVNLLTGELENFDYRTKVTLVSCELNEI